MASPFKKGSQPHKLNEHFKQGKSLTHVEAIEEFKIYHLGQRMHDLKNKYVEYLGKSPIMVLDEGNERGGQRARYFYKGAGSPHESNPKARMY